MFNLNGTLEVCHLFLLIDGYRNKLKIKQSYLHVNSLV